jgi:hypothetical protein
VGSILQQGKVDINESTQKLYIRFLETSLKHQDKSVVIESARIMGRVRGLENRSAKTIIEVLRRELDGDETTVFGALRVMDELIKNPMRQPLLREASELSRLVTHSNKNIMSLAISLQVKTTTPEILEQLLVSLTGQVQELPAFVKLELVETSVSSMRKDPKAAPVILKFLQNCLILARALGEVAEHVEGLRCQALDFLTELIEDSQNSDQVLVCLFEVGRLLLLVGNPHDYFKCLINRLALDVAQVRAAAVTCLG